MPVNLNPETVSTLLSDKQKENLAILLCSEYRNFLNNNLPQGITEIRSEDAVGILLLTYLKARTQSLQGGF